MASITCNPAARAAETSRPDALIRDDFAYLLTASAGPAWAQMAGEDTQWLGDDEYGHMIRGGIERLRAELTRDN